MINEPDDIITEEPRYKPPILMPLLMWICVGLAIGAAIGFIISQAHAEDRSSHVTPPPAQEACQPRQPECVPEPTHVTWCGKWFRDFDVSDHYQKYCLAKLPRLFETNATDDARRYFICRCEYQGSIWSRRDP
jgi:hypothetical protein